MLSVTDVAFCEAASSVAPTISVAEATSTERRIQRSETNTFLALFIILNSLYFKLIYQIWKLYINANVQQQV
jgi:ABC-type amino acid transport system permease subunit